MPLIAGEQMYQALKSKGSTRAGVYPGQFHGFTQPSFIRIATNAGWRGGTSI